LSEVTGLDGCGRYLEELANVLCPADPARFIDLKPDVIDKIVNAIPVDADGPWREEGGKLYDFYIAPCPLPMGEDGDGPVMGKPLVLGRAVAAFRRTDADEIGKIVMLELYSSKMGAMASGKVRRCARTQLPALSAPPAREQCQLAPYVCYCAF
jgi:hypothetical protein